MNNCEQERIVITIHHITKRFVTIDGIGRLHLSCNDCNTSICMKYKSPNHYREGQKISVYLGGEVDL